MDSRGLGGKKVIGPAVSAAAMRIAIMPLTIVVVYGSYPPSGRHRGARPGKLLPTFSNTGNGLRIFRATNIGRPDAQ
jgi:hypothetical protein